MAWLLHQILLPFLSEVPAHLENTCQLLTRLKAIPAEQLRGKIPISLDVVSLYTNVNTQEAISVTDTLLRTKYGQQVWGIPVDLIIDILTFILRNNCFHFNGMFFKQTRGLAMGSKISPILAILVMDQLERSTLFQQTLLHPVTFLRYIDDCVLIIDRDIDLANILERLNSLHESIKFELQKPRQDNFLPVLDTLLRISESGQVQHKFYVKEANRGLFIHALSALPTCIKRNAIKEEIHRAKSLSSEQSWKLEATKHMTDKFRSNGYTSEQIKQHTKQRHRNQQHPEHNRKPFDSSCIMKVPFISNKFNGQLKRLVNKYALGIQLVTQPAPSLARRLIKNKRHLQCNKRSCPIKDPQICNARNVVYKATCTICDKYYIGSTSPPFHNRVAQHLQPSRKTAVHLHAITHHQSARETFQFSIISRHPNEIRCRIAEALAIERLSPPLNGREEFVDYKPFLI